MEKYYCNKLLVENNKLKVWIKKQIFNDKTNKFIDSEEEEFKEDGKYITGPWISLKNFEDVGNYSNVDLKKLINDFLSNCDFWIPLAPQLELYLKNINLLNIEENSLKDRYLDVLNKTNNSLKQPSKIFKEFIYYLNSQSLNENIKYLEPEIKKEVELKALNGIYQKEQNDIDKLRKDFGENMMGATFLWWLGGFLPVILTGLISSNWISSGLFIPTYIGAVSFTMSLPVLYYFKKKLSLNLKLSKLKKEFLSITDELEKELNKVKEVYYYSKLTKNLIEEFEKDLLLDIKLPINIYKITSEIEYLIKKYKELINDIEKDFKDFAIVDLKKSLLEDSEKRDYVEKIVELNMKVGELKENYITYTKDFNLFLEQSKILVEKDKINDSINRYMEEYKSINNELNKEGISDLIKSKLKERLEKAKNDIKMTNFRNLLISWFMKKQEFEKSEQKLELISLNEYQKELLEHLNWLQTVYKKMLTSSNKKLNNQAKENVEMLELTKNIL